MNARDRGFLLLTSHLGDPQRKVLTVAQFRQLAQRVSLMAKPKENRQLTVQDMILLGYSEDMALRILSLLSDEEQLSWYVQKGAKMDCQPITRVSEGYPISLRQRLGTDCPGCLWTKGDQSLLKKQAVALVGSRDLLPSNYAFAEEVGRQAAKQGFVLVSGNARGADRVAQEACLDAGGQVISVVADSLQKCPLSCNVLYLSEDSFDSDFSAQRALSRNRVIHCLADRVFVAQCSLGKGGTWSGVTQNLRHNWSNVFCFADESHAMQELIQRGAEPIKTEDLQNLPGLTPQETKLF